MPRNKKAAAWTPRESDTLAAMRRRGASDAEIGQVLGRSCSSIASRASTLRRTGTADVPALRQWTDAEVERVIDLWDPGETNAAIGAAIGRSEWAVRERIRWLQADGDLGGRVQERRPRPRPADPGC